MLLISICLVFKTQCILCDAIWCRYICRFEKMVAGMYLGEIVRHILVYLVKQKLLLRGEMPEKFMIKEAVATKYLTEVER